MNVKYFYSIISVKFLIYLIQIQTINFYLTLIRLIQTKYTPCNIFILSKQKNIQYFITSHREHKHYERFLAQWCLYHSSFKGRSHLCLLPPFFFSYLLSCPHLDQHLHKVISGECEIISGTNERNLGYTIVSIAFLFPRLHLLCL